MQKLKISLIISCAFLIATTTPYLLEAQESQGSKESSAAVGASNVNLNGRDLKPVPINEGLVSPKKKKYAFLVGAVRYKEGLSSLSFPGADVEAIKARLIEIGFRDENIVVLRSGDDFGVPTKENIETCYKELLSRVKKGDLVFVYLSGHGLQLNDSDVSYFAPVDVNLKDVEKTSVSINEMMRQLSDSPAKFRWMIVDACRNDPNHKKSIFTAKAPNAKGLASIDNIPPTISLLQSCQPGAYSYEGGADVQNGIFTLALLEALSEEGKGDLNGDDAVSFLEICQYVTTRTNALANKYHNARQVPNLSGNFTDFAFLEGLKKGEAAKLYQEACTFRSQGKYSLAFEKIESALQKDPENKVYLGEKDTINALIDKAKAEADRLESLAENERLKVKLADAERRAAEAEGKKAEAEKAEQERLAAEMEAARLEAEKAKIEAGLSGEGTGVTLIDTSWIGTFKAGTRKTFMINGVEFAFRYCPAGAFTMGSPSNEKGRSSDETRHEVKLTKGFWIQETELTQEQWDALGVKKEKESYFKGKNLPVETVNWNEIVVFINKLNTSGQVPKGIKFSLPTEAQWEYACRAGSKTAYSWGDSLNGDKANCNGNSPCGTTIKGKYLEKTSPVKSYDPNPWGLYDMHGNVGEWCSDWYDDYPSGSVVDPTGATNASYRVIRGGGWLSNAKLCRSAYRYFIGPANRNDDVGFRLASK